MNWSGAGRQASTGEGAPTPVGRRLSGAVRGGVVAAGLLLTCLTPLAAGTYPDWQGVPLYGTLNAHADEVDWLSMIPVRAGGSTPMPEEAGEACAGYVEFAQPDLDLNLRTDEPRDLIIRLATREPLMIVVYTSEREWVCSPPTDGTETGQVGLLVEGVSPGNFNVWIGHRESGDDMPRVDMTLEFVQGVEGLEL